jgi:hypothetical protein
MASGVRSVIRYIDELKKARLVVVQRRGLGKTNIYRLAKWVDSGTVKTVDLEAESRTANPASMESPKTRTLKMPILQGKQTQVKPDTEEVDPIFFLSGKICGLLACPHSRRAAVRDRLAALDVPAERLDRAIGRVALEWCREQGERVFWERLEWELGKG